MLRRCGPVSVTVVASFNPSTTNINLSTSTNTTLNLSAPAQAGGLTFTLSSDSPAIATVPGERDGGAGRDGDSHCDYGSFGRDHDDPGGLSGA